MICVQNGRVTHAAAKTHGNNMWKTRFLEAFVGVFCPPFFLRGVTATYSPTSQSLSLLVLLQQAAIEFYS
jgi:hypothetical protein